MRGDTQPCLNRAKDLFLRPATWDFDAGILEALVDGFPLLDRQLRWLDGPGIPDEEKQRVMEPFYRMDPARQVTGGFGLGLAIVLAIAETHGGTLTLLDRQPRGLCARISFPAATSADLRAT